MHNHLIKDRTNLSSLLEKTKQASDNYQKEIDHRPPATSYIMKDHHPLSESGAGAEKTLDLFLERYGNHIPASNGPRFWGLVTGGTTPAAILGDWLTSAYDLNLSHAGNSVAPDIEMEAISMLRELFGLPASFSGHLLPARRCQTLLVSPSPANGSVANMASPFRRMGCMQFHP